MQLHPVSYLRVEDSVNKSFFRPSPSTRVAAGVASPEEEEEEALPEAVVLVTAQVAPPFSDGQIRQAL